jgi:hypothetical protein
MAFDGAFNGWDKYWSLVEWDHESALYILRGWNRIAANSTSYDTSILADEQGILID